ncbi:MAG: Cys-tRNA(Pro) deacylase [Blastocatellia bacterium]|nr:Cys-tRNA(Pro) deacylase [Blastocatellia bacterium]MBL8193216.1 Cys-tRNA(Pro) deacylase [Blastocatellia bacterium]MBN8722268.1 Cys-tRNA(Pro) deacylase [Acidobacteriota bacterium]
MKTTAVRILDQLKIDYELREYQVNEDELDAQTVANKINWPAEKVFKTLVARSTRGSVVMACIPATCELNLKSLAQLIKDKKVELVPVKEIQSLTGYIRGGVSPLATKKSYPLYLDISAVSHDKISISAGRRGLQMLLAPKDLQNITKAILAKLTNE